MTRSFQKIPSQQIFLRLKKFQPPFWFESRADFSNAPYMEIDKYKK